MCAMQSIPDEQANRIIEDSIRRRSRAVLTSKCSSGWRTFKAKFVEGTRTSGKLRFLVRFPPAEPAPILPTPGGTVGVTFRVGHKKCMYSTTLGSLEQRDDGTLFTVGWPEYLEQLQRRAYERVPPPRGSVVAVRFWREYAGAAGDGSRTVRHGQLEDVSAGGMRIQVSDMSDIEMHALYKCVFAPRSGAPSLVLEATLRHQEAADKGRASLGFQFIGLETTADGRRTLDQLARFVKQYQHADRHHSRRGHVATR